MTEKTLDLERFDQMVSYLGDDLSKFVFAASERPMAGSLTHPQLEVARLLLAALAETNYNEWDPLRRWQDISSKLCSYSPQLDGTLATNFHYHCGGVQPDTSSEDRLEELLCQLAADVYPTYLIGNMRAGAMLPSGSAFAHPLREMAEQQMFQPQEPLMGLFPQADFGESPKPGCGRSWELMSMATWSDGSGGSIQFAGIVEAILRKASWAQENDESPLEAYVRSVRSTLEISRTLAQGREAHVPALAGFYGVSFAGGVRQLRLSHGRLRLKTPIDNALINQTGSEDVVFEVPVRLRRTSLQSGTDSSWAPPSQADQQELEKFHEELQGTVGRARMAVVLASDQEEVFAPGQSFLTIPNPLTSGGSWSMSPLAWPMAQFPSRPLEQADETTMRGWDVLLAQIPQGMRTGQERILAAVSERYSPHDGFIDAVIAWENLFGAAGETALRVCGSLARILHPDDKKSRSDFYTKIKKMYDQRSKLVHGGENRISHATAVDLRNDAVHIAIDAWRAVLESDELRAAKDSATRGNLVMINGAT